MSKIIIMTVDPYSITIKQDIDGDCKLKTLYGLHVWLNTKIFERCKHDKGEIMKQSIIDHNVLRALSYDFQDILFSCQNTFMGVKEVQLLVYIQM